MVFTLIPFDICSQIQNPERSIFLILRDSITTYTDSMYIIPESIRVQAMQEKIQVEVYGRNMIIRTKVAPVETQILFNVLVINPDMKLSVFDSTKTEQIKIRAIQPLMETKNKYKKPDDLFRSEGVEYAGAFGRGLSFGNNQNLVLNSTLNLQLSGKLGDDIEINAAISDETLPIQADGNTQQLNELDNVFVEIKRKNKALMAGDIQVTPDGTYFLNYFKKYKGIQFQSHDQIKEKGRITTKLQGSIARGNFKRESLSVQEGNQGPYRLTGQNNEQFIIVLSGSEKVYLDGQLLIRGLENDYSMDYNRSEISFTARRVINRNSRIVVEFEYSNQSYFKSALALQSNYKYKNWTVQWNSYQETENKTASITQSLNDEDIRTLSNAGDQVQNLTRSTIRPIENETDNIFYILKDSTVHHVKYQNILVLDQTKQVGTHTAGFTYVGAGNGNYIIEKNLFTNGRAYRWVAPDQQTNTKQGDYEPYTTLSAPKKQGMHTIRLEYEHKESLYTLTELGLSNTDFNLFSKKDKSNDLGMAWKQTLKWKKRLGKLTWINEVNGEKQSANFTLFEPFRNPEFNRDWALGNAFPQNGGDLFLNIKTQIEHNKVKGSYTFKHYDKQHDYSGQMHTLHTNYLSKYSQLDFSSSYLKNKLGNIDGDFFRPKISFQHRLGKSTTTLFGVVYEKEKNRQRNEKEKTLFPQSFSFEAFQAYFHGDAVTKRLSYQINFSTRNDDKINNFNFIKHYTSTEWSIANQWNLSKTSNWGLRLTNRKLVFDPINKTNGEKNTNTLIWRQSLDARSGNDGFRYRQTLESGTGQEPAIEYTYIKVNKGAGYYTWIDINKDSVTQVSEFVLAPYADQGEYIRYAIAGNEFVLSKNYTFLQDIEISGMKWKRPDQHLKWYHKISFLSGVNLNWKTQSGIGFKFPFSSTDIAILSMQGQVRNQLYLNRGGQFLEIQTGQFLTNVKWRLSTGSEIRNQNEYFLRSRHRINNKLSIENHIAYQHQQNNTEFIAEKNLNFKAMIFEPMLNFQTKQKLRISTAYKFKIGKELLQSIKTNIHELKVEAIAQPDSKWSIRSTCSQIWADVQGQLSAWNEFNLLQGLRSGGNTLIGFQADRILNNNTILRLGYNGRKSNGSKYIQSGNAQILASF